MDNKNTITIRRLSNGWVFEGDKESTVHTDAYSVWMRLGDSLVPGISAEQIMEEILSNKITQLNLKFTKVKLKAVKE